MRRLRQCQHCRCQYTPKASNRITYCSRECSYAERDLMGFASQFAEHVSARLTLMLMRCESCNEILQPTNKNHRFCDDCFSKRMKTLAQQYHKQNKKVITSTCRYCKQEYSKNHEWGKPRKRRGTCGAVECIKESKRDGRRNRKHNQRYRAARARLSAKRQQLIMAGKRDTIIKQKLGERDGWLCGICREAIDKTLHFTHPMSATIDHVLPIIKGGTHTWDNVQIAHRKCNCCDKRDQEGYVRVRR